MTKLVWLSDLHFVHEGDVLGHDPRVQLQAAVDFINTHLSDSDYCVISGDLVNAPTAENYSALAEILSGLNVPILPMVGNHDDRVMLRAALPMPKTAMQDFVQYDQPAGDALILCLDTLKPGAEGGVFCPARNHWLREKLRQAGDVPIYLFMHHPPMRLGLPMLDEDNLEDGDMFLDLLSEFENVKYLFIGHVHRPVSGTIRGVPFSAMRSVLFQAPAPMPVWDWDSFAPSQEAPNLGVITLDGPNCTLHYVQFSDYQGGEQVQGV